jgi:hypothetical protein
LPFEFVFDRVAEHWEVVDRQMQQLQSQKVAPEPSSRKSSQKWSNLKEPFGNVLHKRFPFGVGSVPADVDLALLRPGVEADFLDDKTRTLLKIPVNRKPRMALGEAHHLAAHIQLLKCCPLHQGATSCLLNVCL